MIVLLERGCWLKLRMRVKEEGVKLITQQYCNGLPRRIIVKLVKILVSVLQARVF